MRNGLGRTNDVVSSTNNTNALVTNTNSTLSYYRYSSSGYTGPRPKSLDRVYNPFTYEIGIAENIRLLQTEVFSPPMYISNTQTTKGGCLSRTQFGYQIVPDDRPSDNEVYNELLEKLYEKVRGNIDLSIDIAQAGQTARMFSATAQVEDFTKTFGRKFAILKLPANLWLQYVYGVKPLLSTVYEAAEAASNVVINNIERFSVRRTKVLTNPRVELLLYNGTYGRLRTKSTGKVSYTIGGAYTTSNEFDPARWSSLNPVSIAWELVPYSFVADWFYDVGGYLRSLESSLLMRNSWKGGYLSKLVALDGDIDHVEVSGDAAIRMTKIYSGSFKFRSFNRSRVISAPTPRAPTFKANLGSSRLVSAAALLSGFLGNRR